MALVINQTKQKHGFWSEVIKARHGVKSGMALIAPGENQIPSDVVDEIKKNKYFAQMVKDNQMIVKTDRQEQKSIDEAEKALKDAAKAEADAKAKAQAEVVKAEQAKIAQLKKDLADAGVDKRTLNGKNLAQLTAMFEEATKA
jgi:hypothetical protein